MVLQPITDIAEICALKGLEHAVISPGSRSAAITLAFARHPSIQKKMVSDERSAGFIALGMAQILKKPIVLICTSGSALYNYAPAIAEAFYQQVPLLVLTADRPPEWIDQWDGQTIRQQDIFGKHVKASYQLPTNYQHPDEVWQINRSINEAINLASAYPSGPVHVNIPLREPFYPAENEALVYSKEPRIIAEFEGESSLSAQQWETLQKEWLEYPKKIIVLGQQTLDQGQWRLLEDFSKQYQIPVVADILSNAHGTDSFIQHADVFLGTSQLDFKGLSPDLMITWGKSVISKNLKLFIRKHKPKAHWHVQASGYVPDAFQGLSKILRTELKLFLEQAGQNLPRPKLEDSFYQQWLATERKLEAYWPSFFSAQAFGEFVAYRWVIQHLPACALHLANSMAVRYANLIGLQQEDIEVFANRGTSGIDGSTSTAVGSALASGKLTVLLTGDMAFFYDRNAFWHQNNLKNLRVVVFNNHAGGIFGLIDGPAKLPELETYFETKQSLTAELTAQEVGAEYYFCDSEEGLKNHLQHFFEASTQPKILEIRSDTSTNRAIFKNYKSTINQYYGA